MAGCLKVPKSAREKHRAWFVDQGRLRSAGVVEIHAPVTRKEFYQLYPQISGWGKPQEFFVYGLVSAGRLIYVGKSGEVGARIQNHACGVARAHDSVLWLRVDSHASAAWWESVLIDIFRPECNAHWGDVLMERYVTERAILLLLTEAGPEIEKIARRAMTYQSGVNELR